MPYKDPAQQKLYQREYQKKWYQKNKRKKKARDRANYINNRAAYLATNREWERRNKESVREHKRQYYRENRERILARCHRWIANNLEKRRARGRAYAKENRDKYNAAKAKRRAVECASGGSFTAMEWKALVEFYGHRCLKCGKPEPEIKLTADHIIPVTMGGSSFISNIQPLCGRCNRSKGKRVHDYRTILPPFA